MTTRACKSAQRWIFSPRSSDEACLLRWRVRRTLLSTNPSLFPLLPPLPPPLPPREWGKRTTGVSKLHGMPARFALPRIRFSSLLSSTPLPDPDHGEKGNLREEKSFAARLRLRSLLSRAHPFSLRFGPTPRCCDASSDRPAALGFVRPFVSHTARCTTAEIPTPELLDFCPRAQRSVCSSLRSLTSPERASLCVLVVWCAFAVLARPTVPPPRLPHCAACVLALGAQRSVACSLLLFGSLLSAFLPPSHERRRHRRRLLLLRCCGPCRPLRP